MPHDHPKRNGTQYDFDSVVKPRYWKNRALELKVNEVEPGSGKLLTQADIDLMNRGRAFIGPDGMPMELEHIVPQRSGVSSANRLLFECTQLEHSFLDRYRIVYDSAGRRFNTNEWTDPRP